MHCVNDLFEQCHLSQVKMIIPFPSKIKILTFMLTAVKDMLDNICFQL